MLADNSRNHGAGVVERVTFLGNSADVIMRCSDVKLRVRTHPARTPAVGKAVRFRRAHRTRALSFQAEREWLYKPTSAEST